MHQQDHAEIDLLDSTEHAAHEGGFAAAATSQITGSLLVFALLVLPPATAQRLTTRPAVGVALSAGIAVAVTWLGLALAYYSSYPIGFFVTTIAFAVYVGASGAKRLVA